MIVRPIRTEKVLPHKFMLSEILDKHLPDIKEKSILAVTSKVVSICEGRVVPAGSISKEALIKKESDYYLPSENHKYGYHFSIVNNTLISSAGIDQSNSDGNFVLWPQDPQQSADNIRAYLASRFGLRSIGVIITDSMSRPFRLGSSGTYLAHSGFKAVKDYRHSEDLFGREMQFSMANIAEGIASAAVVTMGEGTEQTPLAVISDIPFVDFQSRVPSAEELAELKLTLENDYFEVFFNSVPWQKGQRATDD